MNISTSTTVYGLLNSQAQEEGYESFRDQIVGERNINSDDFEYDKEIDGNDVRVNIVIDDLNVSNSSSISIEDEAGELVSTDTTVLNESAEPPEEDAEELLSGLTVEYTLVMPGEISNATTDDVERNTATWTETGSTAWTDTRIEARSEAPSGSAVPRFGVTAVTVAILATSLLALRRES